jgi:tRNA U34 5-methylaminomethyl-2-thiouridine-forming methyltransferase MnmC
VKVSFINANGIEYMAQYDKENVLFSRQGDHESKKMVIVELHYGVITSAKVIQNKNIINLPTETSVKINADPHDIVRHYAPISETTTI